MSYRLEWHAAAKLDYQEAYIWYEEKQNGLGERFAASVRQLVTAILDHPEAYGHRAKKKYREARIRLFPYSIIYTVYKDKQVIIITAVHHHKKHPQGKYKRKG